VEGRASARSSSVLRADAIFRQRRHRKEGSPWIRSNGLRHSGGFSAPCRRLHHNAYVVKDHEANRRFLEDLLGIPLVATWCEKTYRADLGREVEFCHTFFALKDGGALAFFQFADEEMYQLTQAKEPPRIGSHYHIAAKGQRRCTWQN
jgi:hypothetical protein